jgi:acyl dehydratase
VNKGDRFEQVLTEDLTRTQIVQYAGVSGDYNPVHTDEVFAVHAGFPSVFAHGMLTMAMTARALTGWRGEPHPLRRALQEAGLAGRPPGGHR